MPDLGFERIELNAIPSGDMPVFHASQYETMRPFISDLKWGDAEFAPGEGCWCTLSIRKTDDTLVIIDSMDIDNNTVSCILPQQAVACVGDNFCQLKVWAEENSEDGCIACLNFILQVQPDPEAGGLTSESEIQNLETQIAEIVPEVIGNDYYNKTETDALLATKADTTDIPDMSQYYTKTATDSLLDGKLNTYQMDNTLPIGDVIAARVQQVYNSDIGYYDEVSNVALDVYSKDQVDAIIDGLLPVGSTGPDAVASFDTALAVDLVDCKTALAPTLTGYTAVNLTACGVNLWDEEWELGGIDVNTGNLIPMSDRIRSKNLIPVKGGSSYYFERANIAGNIFEYDANGNFIRLNGSPTSFTTATNTCFLRFYMASAYGTTYNNDISINYPSTDTTYHAYTGNAYTIALGDTYYGGTLDVTTGVMTVEYDSSLQPITPYDVQLSPTAVRAIVGVNNVYSDTGDTTVQYKDNIQHYIDTRV